MVKEGRIIDITLLEHRNEKGKPAEKILNQIVKQQKVPVDVVSGCTCSSKVIMKALEQALKNKS